MSHRLVGLLPALTICDQFFCGPPVLSKQLHVMSNKYSNPGGTRFFFGKGELSSPYACLVGLLTEYLRQRTSDRRQESACPSVCNR